MVPRCVQHRDALHTLVQATCAVHSSATAVHSAVFAHSNDDILIAANSQQHTSSTPVTVRAVCERAHAVLHSQQLQQSVSVSAVVVQTHAVCVRVRAVCCIVYACARGCNAAAGMHPDVIIGDVDHVCIQGCAHSSL